MKISVSNIAWKSEYDDEMYKWMQQSGIEGIEIAPTRLMGDNPYDRIREASDMAEMLWDKYGLRISSMQSIWYQKKENIFASQADREELTAYTKKAIDYAKAIHCNNLVMGCPKNRNIPEGVTESDRIAFEFFKELGEYAALQGTILAMEANPVMYNTNFCNTTISAVELIRAIESKGFKLNFDMGTVIANEEDMESIGRYSDIINHVHISEPGLAMIEKRSAHKRLAEILKESGYEGYVSLEVKTQEDIEEVKKACTYLKAVFG